MYACVDLFWYFAEGMDGLEPALLPSGAVCSPLDKLVSRPTLKGKAHNTRKTRDNCAYCLTELDVHVLY